MLIIKEDTALVGVAELRTKVPDVLREIKKHKVVLTKRNLPVGVIMDYGEYEKMQEILDKIEDFVLAQATYERFERKGRKAITLEDAEKRVGLR